MSDNMQINSNKQPVIRVCDLKKHYPKRNNQPGTVHALNGVTADIYPGEVVVVIGPSGSGKSTFLRSLNLLEEPTDGQIFVNGVDITDRKVNINLHRQKMGMVFQHFNLFPHMTILRNMTIAPMKLLKKSRAEAEGINSIELEEITMSLMDKGLVYEPNLRYLKRI